MSEELQDLMTDKEVCDLLRISSSTLRRHVKDQTSNLQRIKRCDVGGQRRWLRESVDAFINGAIPIS